MKRSLVVCVFLFGAVTGLAQVWVDSLQQRLETVTGGVIATDSLPPLPDSLRVAWERVEGVRRKFNVTADSLQGQYQQTVAQIDEEVAALNRRVDSLTSLQLPTEKYTARLNELKAKKNDAESKFSSKLQELKSKTTGKLNALDLPAQYQKPVQELTAKMDVISIQGGDVQLPGVNIPGYSMPKIPGVEGGALPGKLANIPGLEDTPLGEVSEITGQMKTYQEDIANIASGNLEDVKALPQTLEQKAAEYAGLDKIQQEAGVFDQYKSQVDALSDPETGKEKAVEAARKVAIDHFAGKEEKLKAAMEQMAKYKQKYSSVQSIKDLPKRRPNAMKGKSFRERFIPGLYFQYQQRYYNLYDFNPYVSYRVSGRFTGGVGWNHRFAYNRSVHAWSDAGTIYGPRAFVDFRLGRGFIAHVESEMMNTLVPSVIGGNPEVGHRDWVWGMMTGMKKDYKIWKGLRGTVLLQYNLFNRQYKAPYADRLNSRIGVAWWFGKKKGGEGKERRK